MYHYGSNYAKVFAYQRWSRTHPRSLLLWFLKGLTISGAALYAVNLFGVQLLRDRPFIFLAALVLLFWVSILPSIDYFFKTYFVDRSTVTIRSGIFVKKIQQLPFDNVQSVEVVAGIFGRILGLRWVRLELVDGDSESGVYISCLGREDAVGLRDHILHFKMQLSQPPAEAAPQPQQPLQFPHGYRGQPLAPQERVLVKLSVPDLLLCLITLLPVVLGLLVSLISAPFFITSEWPKPILALGMPIISALAASMGVINSYARFTVTHSPAGLRISSGLSDVVEQTLSPGRIMAVEITRPLLFRAIGRYRVKAHIAGFVVGDSTSTRRKVQRETLLPIGDWGQVQALLEVVLPDQPTRQLQFWADSCLHQRADRNWQQPAPGWVRPPAATAWVSPLQYQLRGCMVDGELLICRRGFFTHRVQLCSLNRLQGVRLSQGPLRRFFNACTLTPVLPPGGLHINCRLMPVPQAEEMALALLVVCGAARRYKDRRQWMSEQELAEFNRRTSELVHAVQDHRQVKKDDYGS